MENYSYKGVKPTPDFVERRSWILFFRQYFVCSGVLAMYLCLGVCYGAPTIFIQQIRKEANSTEAVSVEMASNLSSIFGYSSIPWIFVLTAIGHRYGRRISFLFVSITTSLMFIGFYLSVTTTHLLIVTIIEGIPSATGFTVSVIVLAEYASPEYRGIFLTMKVASIFWGIWFANAIGTFCHWRYIALFGLITSLYSSTAYFWPESPHWLASKRRFDECKKSHRWLRGRGVKAEKELDKLTAGNEILAFGTLSQIKNKEFYRPTLISCLMVLLYYSSGKLVCSIYAIEILKKITSSESAAYNAMLILDAVTVLGMYVGSFLNGVLLRRTQLFIASLISIIFLYVISLYVYLVKLTVITENNVLIVALLVVFSISIGCGPAIMAPSTFGELIPSKYKNMCTVVVAIFFQAITSTVLKIFPYIYMAFGLHGTFFCYGTCMTCVTLLLYKLLPETKDKAIYEIEEYFRGSSFIYRNNMLERKSERENMLSRSTNNGI